MKRLSGHFKFVNWRIHGFVFWYHEKVICFDLLKERIKNDNKMPISLFFSKKTISTLSTQSFSWNLFGFVDSGLVVRCHELFPGKLDRTLGIVRTWQGWASCQLPIFDGTICHAQRPRGARWACKKINCNVRNYWFFCNDSER